MKAAFLGLIGVVVIAFLAVIAAIGVVFFGYGVGLLITLIPFLPPFLVGGPITVTTIPVITAWLAVASAIFAMLSIRINASVTTDKPTVKKIETITK